MRAKVNIISELTNISKKLSLLKKNKNSKLLNIQ